MYYHASIVNQIKRIFKKKGLFHKTNLNNNNNNNNELSDITDGTIYKTIYNSNLKKYFDSNAAFTFTLNTDGISFCEKSNLTMWPVFLAINEIPVEKRFCVENIIIAGNYEILVKVSLMPLLKIIYFFKDYQLGMKSQILRHF